MKALYNWWKSDVDFLWKGKLVIFFCTVDYFFFALVASIFVPTLFAVHIVRVITVHSHLHQCYDIMHITFFRKEQIAGQVVVFIFCPLFILFFRIPVQGERKASRVREGSTSVYRGK